ncbi:MAG: hypothetical protein JSW20_00230 [Nitrospiraceae bacterium]|nr:MAG: hypothetical protein JSW20_00230 [Nitrospiraceae bacterium]
MSQKVWVIDDVNEQQVSVTRVKQKKIPAFQQKPPIRRNPSLAFSLSIILWGCGQFYNKQLKSGILFLVFMFNFYLLMCIVIMHWESIKFLFESIHVDGSGTLLIFGFFYLSGLSVWQVNAWHAYINCIRMSAGSFNATKIKLLPAVCSLFMPGWGQVLNGQIKKSLFFQVFAFMNLAIFPFILIIFLVWPTLEASRSRLVIEWIFSFSIILSPFLIMVWILSIFDAVKVSLHNTKKVPMLIRIKYAAKKFRYHRKLYGLKNTVLPLIKRTTLVLLLLVFCLINYHSVPKKFYMLQLQKLGNQMSEQGMTVMPGIIEKLSDSFSSGK